MTRPRRALTVPANIPPETIDPDEIGDDLTEEEIEQASVGDLISIQGPEFDNVSWSIWRHRTRQELMNDNSDEKLEWVADRTGQLHGTDLVELIGGGTFNMRGYLPRSDGRGVRLKFNRTVAIAGPRKNFAAPLPAPPTPAPTNGARELSHTELLLMQLVDRMDKRLEKVEAQPAASPMTLKDLTGALKDLHEVSGVGKASAPRDPDREIVATYLGMIEKGIEIGRERDPISGENSGPDWAKIAETGMQLLDKLMARAQAQRMANRPRPRAASGAAVVDDATPAVAPPATETPATVINHRWVAAIEKLAAAISANGDPVEFAADLEVILNYDELDRLAMPMVNADAVIAECGVLVDRFPVLKEDRAKPFIEAVLSELRNPPEDASPAS